jgi:FkbM family methyltransferase
MRLTPQNFVWAATHPAHTLRYLRWRDVISYQEIARHLPADPVILEAGAANGQNSREMAEFWPGATLHAFEPVPGAKELLDRAVKDHSARVKTWPYALGDQAGSFEMNVSGEGEAGLRGGTLDEKLDHASQSVTERFDIETCLVRQIEVIRRALMQPASEH